MCVFGIILRANLMRSCASSSFLGLIESRSMFISFQMASMTLAEALGAITSAFSLALSSI
eukprot:232991-Prymnesium_polylepis.1